MFITFIKFTETRESDDKLHVTSTTLKSKDQDKSTEKNTSENKVNDEKKEIENDSEYEGFEREEIAELVEKDHSTELDHEKQSMVNTKDKDDKTNSKEGTDEDYENNIETTPEALSTKGEDKDLMNKMEGNLGNYYALFLFENYVYIEMTIPFVFL